MRFTSNPTSNRKAPSPSKCPGTFTGSGFPCTKNWDKKRKECYTCWLPMTMGGIPFSSFILMLLSFLTVPFLSFGLRLFMTSFAKEDRFALISRTCLSRGALNENRFSPLVFLMGTYSAFFFWWSISLSFSTCSNCSRLFSRRLNFCSFFFLSFVSSVVSYHDKNSSARLSAS